MDKLDKFNKLAWKAVIVLAIIANFLFWLRGFLFYITGVCNG